MIRPNWPSGVNVVFEESALLLCRATQSGYDTRGTESNLFNKQKLNTVLDTKAWRNITLMKHLEASNTSKGHQSRLLKPDGGQFGRNTL
jgi:hypothetical protein